VFVSACKTKDARRRGFVPLFGYGRTHRDMVTVSVLGAERIRGKLLQLGAPVTKRKLAQGR